MRGMASSPRSVAPEPPMPQPEIMTANEVAQYMRVDVRTVTHYAKEGKIPGFQAGTIWRFHRKKILALFDAPPE